MTQKFDAQAYFDKARAKMIARRAKEVARSRFPALKKVDGKVVCRGCHGEVKPPRQTWCSQECVDKYHPFQVRKAVDSRDGGKCQMCGVMTLGRFDRGKHLIPSLRREYDHIIPFCEGGPTTLENMRTLCHGCHKERTAVWRKERKATNDPHR